jgi:CBS-domain-containing membrane protein
VVVVQASDPVEGLIRRFAFADQTVYPVVDERRRLLGVVTLRSLGALAQGDQPPDPGLTARDVAAPTEALTLDVTLLEVVRRLGAQGIAALPVVDAPSSRVLGTIGRAGILARYGRATAERTG